MKLAFICGCLEPGKDGVGDYTSLLGSALMLQGHQVLLIAIKDNYVRNDDPASSRETANGADIVRFSNVIARREELLSCKRLLTSFDPDLISLQFVPFSFHPKGLNRNLASKLKYLGEGKRWHVMFHELWVGMAINSALKFKIWGMLQQHLILQLLNKLKPVISTQTTLYQMQLKRLGFEAAVLPLFSNIPSHQGASLKNHQKKDINFVVFGTIQKHATIAAFAAEAAQYAQEKKVRITLTFIGRCGEEQEHWIAVWSQAGLKYKVLGEQDLAFVAETLSKGSYGLCSTALAVVDKSGSVAAMRANGLAIICVAQAWFPSGIAHIEEPADIIVYHSGNFAECLQRKVLSANAFHVSDAANLFFAHVNGQVVNKRYLPL